MFIYIYAILFCFEVDEIWITGLYDPDSNSTTSAVAGLGSTAISITSSQVSERGPLLLMTVKRKTNLTSVFLFASA